MSKFYQKFGRITIGDDLIGSDMPGPNGKSSSVIMAYWPCSSETLDNIDYNRMSIGVVQYYIRHVISMNLKVYQRKWNIFLLMSFGKKNITTSIGLAHQLPFVVIRLRQ